MIALFFDTETTGFGDARIVQLGAILQDMDTRRILAEFNGMVDTEGIEIPENASAIHGITNNLADSYGFNIQAVDKIFAKMLMKTNIVVAHNINFDLNVARVNLPISYGFLATAKQYCTMQNTIDVLKLPGKFERGGYKWPKLMEAYKHYFGIEFDNAHDAMADVRACRDIYIKLTQGV